jgi:hypothetical protein
MIGRTNGGRGRLVLIACMALAISVTSVAIAGSGDERIEQANLGKKFKKLSKKVKNLGKELDEVNESLENVEGTPGPAGAQGDPGAAGSPGAPGAPGAPGGSNVFSDFEASTVGTTSAVEESQGGPQVTVNLSQPAILRISGGYEVNDSADATECRSYLVSASLPGPNLFFISDINGVGFIPTQRAGAADRFLLAGTHTFELFYRREAGADTCQYRNRVLTVEKIG